MSEELECSGMTEAVAARYAGTRSSGWRTPVAHRPRHLRRRHLPTWHAACLFRAQPVRAARINGIDASGALALPGAGGVYRR
ncbi:aerobic-type carbon monoxide dehydrogenase, CoxL domain protein [Mycobacterium xenopi 3993]|nr:aerobic-type carbon monoxide dehydrogenase, CoxL domain protein [Mycobacterium xenopi 3993]